MAVGKKFYELDVVHDGGVVEHRKEWLFRSKREALKKGETITNGHIAIREIRWTQKQCEKKLDN